MARGQRGWVRCRPDFFLPVRVLSRLFRRLFLEGLAAAFDTGELQFFSNLVALRDREAFEAYLAPLRTREWVVYAKRPFAGPKQVLAYLARYTHRVAIGNTRLLELTDEHVSFRWKDYRENGDHKNKVMKLAVGEFMRRFLLHVLPRVSNPSLGANLSRHRRRARSLPELQGGRGGVWANAVQVSIGRHQPNRRNIALRRRDDANDALRSGPDHAAAFGEMVMAQGLGDEDRQAPRDEEQIPDFRVWTGGLAVPVSTRHFPISVSACPRPVRYVTETGLRSLFRACTAAKVERWIDCPAK